MPNNYPLLYKELVIKKYNDINNNINIKDFVNRYNISKSTLYNWLNKNINGESLEKKNYIRTSKYTPVIKCYIRSYVIRKIAFDCNRLIQLIKKKYNSNTSKSGIYKVLSTMKITRKKVKRKLINKNKDIKSMQIEFLKIVNPIDPCNIISIDETSVDTQLYPLYGWSRKGKKIIMTREAAKKRYTIITAISNEKIIHYDIIKNSANAIDFKNFLINLVNKGIQNKYLLVDNARIHHSTIIKEYIKTTSNKLLYNVPYSPELNPIEHVFSKFKSILRKKINTVITSKLIKNIKAAFSKITKSDLYNYYKKSLNK